MFGKLFGRKKTRASEAEQAAWHDTKQARLEAALGKAGERVLHVLVSDPRTGPFHLQFFHAHLPGTGLATLHLANPGSDGPKNAQYRAFEMVIFSRQVVGLGDDLSDVSGRSPGGLLSAALNEMAAYAFQADLEPGCTLEFPADYDEAVGGRCFVIDAYLPEAFDETFGLMLVIEVHRDEVAFAMQAGGANLVDKLRSAGAYPYSDLNRPSVVGGQVH